MDIIGRKLMLVTMGIQSHPAAFPLCKHHWKQDLFTPHPHPHLFLPHYKKEDVNTCIEFRLMFYRHIRSIQPWVGQLTWHCLSGIWRNTGCFCAFWTNQPMSRICRSPVGWRAPFLCQSNLDIFARVIRILGNFASKIRNPVLCNLEFRSRKLNLADNRPYLERWRLVHLPTILSARKP